MRPTTVAELSDLVRDCEQLPIPLLAPGEGLSFAGLSGEIRHDVADGVVSCLAGTTLNELNDVLARDDRCIPYETVWPTAADSLPLAVIVLLGLPHLSESTHGSWRDWILGATMVTAEGTIVKAGSRVVKSVAGYDAHKLLVGSRGTLIVPAEIALRTYHLSAMPVRTVPERIDETRSIIRVKPSELPGLLRELGDAALASDPTSGTVWSSVAVQDLPLRSSGWAMDPIHPEIEERLLALHRRAKATLDPTGKLAPNAFANL